MSYPIKLENGNELWIALTLWQPWATMIEAGAKTIETRKWRTTYRGGVLICAGKTIDPRYASSGFRLSDLPLGQAVCTARLVDCHRMTEADEPGARCKTYPGAWAWVLEEIRAITPFPVRGQPGFFEVEVPHCVIDWSIGR